MFAIKRCLTSGIRAGQNALSYKGKHTLPNLPYEYNALEPVICSEIMELHHQKHHAAYVNGLNDAEEKIKEASGKSDFATIIQLADALRFNGGGHINHSLFWENLTPCPEQPSEELMCCICADFESLDKLRDELQKLAVGVQGSGWAWLGYRKCSGRLEIAKCANQDPLEPTTGLIPLLGIDVWEHAYYIQYKNVRADYVKNLWDIINWKTVSERLTKARQ